MNRRTFLLGTAGTALFLAGCNQSGGSTETTGTPAQTATHPPTGTAETTTHPALVSNPDAVRTCETSDVRGTRVDWNKLPVVTGPIAFSAFPQEDATGRAYPYKTAILVKPNTAVTVVVPETEREHIALSYAPDRNPRTLEQGQRSVRFEACADRVTIFIGATFAEINCVRLQIWVDTEDTPRTVVLPFFDADCT
jgi:hypothetical protein